MANPFHPELASARWIPPFSYGPLSARVFRRLLPRPLTPPEDLVVEEVIVSGDVSLRMFRPSGADVPIPALLWFHGGGHLFGSPEQDDRTSIALARELGIVVAAARYRRGADAPAPASVDDAYAALAHLSVNAAELGIDPAHIAIGGASAGGGVAAGLALYAHDRQEYPIAFQLLVYPMLDDRTVTRTDLGTLPVRVWTAKSNRLGWRTYLDREPGAADVPPYAAPARREDLAGLPPAWIGVGTLDLFHDEDVEYARRLREAGVTCTLKVVDGAFHGFDQVFSRRPVAQSFLGAQIDALRAAGVSSR